MNIKKEESLDSCLCDFFHPQDEVERAPKSFKEENFERNHFYWDIVDSQEEYHHKSHFF